MQHIENQMTNVETKTLTMHQRWNIIFQAINSQNCERVDHVMTCLEELQNRISKDNILQQAKVKLIFDQLQKLKRDVTTVKTMTNRAPEIQNQAKQQFKNKNKNFKKSYQDNADLANNLIRQQMQNQLADISNLFSQKNYNVIQKTQNAMDKLRKESNNLKNIIQKQRQVQKNAFKTLNENILAQTEKLNSCIGEIRGQRKQSEEKLNNMMDELDNLFGKLVQDQIMQGQTTYDCLMKLFEDTCSKVQQNLLK